LPKIKTRRSAAKRFKKTATGKIRRAKAYGSHLLSKKRRDRKRRLRNNDIISKVDRKKVEKLIPYL